MPKPLHEHPLVPIAGFRSPEALVTYLMHHFTYEEIARRSIGSTRHLDVGCNVGYGLPVLRDVVEDVTGVDVSPTAIAAAKQHLNGTDVSVQLIEEDGRLPFEDGSFATVSSCQVIEHVPDVPSFLAEIRRVLEPGGRAYFSTPNGRLRLEPGFPPWNPEHLREYAPEELRRAIAEHFQVEAVLGLYATDAVEAVERARIAEARRGVRRIAVARRVARALLPTRVRTALRRLIGHDGASRSTVALPAFGTDAFRYEQGEIDDALDLLVVCLAA
ncbi:MAG: class I SAM-dependent methyltransferase [Alphaproteobacteria bacterium]|nr:class I SAM-dependent methyltransferase [Alphaproteobacteria bacterium]